MRIGCCKNLEKEILVVDIEELEKMDASESVLEEAIQKKY